jgi:hypothetical protein
MAAGVFGGEKLLSSWWPGDRKDFILLITEKHSIVWIYHI